MGQQLLFFFFIIMCYVLHSKAPTFTALEKLSGFFTGFPLNLPSGQHLPPKGHCLPIHLPVPGAALHPNWRIPGATAQEDEFGSSAFQRREPFLLSLEGKMARNGHIWCA